MQHRYFWLKFCHSLLRSLFSQTSLSIFSVPGKSWAWKKKTNLNGTELEYFLWHTFNIFWWTVIQNHFNKFSRVVPPVFFSFWHSAFGTRSNISFTLTRLVCPNSSLFKTLRCICHSILLFPPEIRKFYYFNLSSHTHVILFI